jgi:hypothetical protein
MDRVPDRDAIGRVRSAGEAIERRLAAAAGEHHCNYMNEIGKIAHLNTSIVERFPD